jgi:hypothetical protein
LELEEVANDAANRTGDGLLRSLHCRRELIEGCLIDASGERYKIRFDNVGHLLSSVPLSIRAEVGLVFLAHV